MQSAYHPGWEIAIWFTKIQGMNDEISLKSAKIWKTLAEISLSGFLIEYQMSLNCQLRLNSM